MASQNMKKGISPLIASVLLIAFTLSVAMIASPFFSNTLKDLQSGVSEDGVEITRASNLGLDIGGVSFNRSSDQLEVTVQNTGEAIDNKTNISIGVIGGSVAKTQQYDVDLGSQEITTLSVPVDRTYPLDTVQATLTNYPVSTESGVKCTPTKGLVGYWTFNEEQTENGNTTDLSGFSNEGNLTAGVETGARSPVGESFFFDDSQTDGVKIPHQSQYSTEDFSVLFWLRSYSYSGGWRHFVHKKTWGNGNNWGFIQNNNGDVSWDFNNDTIYRSSSSIPNSESNWMFIAGTFKDSLIKVYKDSKKVGETDFQGEISNEYNTKNPAPLLVGHNQEIDSRLDEVRFYNRSLSQSEIQRLYQVRSEDWAVDACKLKS